MKNLSVFAIPAAIALVLASAASTAQDKPATTSAKKSNAPVSSPSTAAKSTGQAPTPLNSTNTKALNERSGANQSPPTTNRIAPASERGHGSCHDMDSDA